MPKRTNYMQVIEGSETCLNGHSPIVERPMDGTPWKCAHKSCKYAAPTTTTKQSNEIDSIINSLADDVEVIRHTISTKLRTPAEGFALIADLKAQAIAQLNLLLQTEFRRGEQKPVGAGLEIKVASETMQAVMARIKLKDKTIADRVLEPLWRIEKWRNGTGDKYDLEVEQWKLRILANLTRQYNWAVFLLRPDNLQGLKPKTLTPERNRT